MSNDFLQPRLIAFVNRRIDQIIDREWDEERRFYNQRRAHEMACFRKKCQETISFRFAGKNGPAEERLCILIEETRLLKRDVEERDRRWSLPSSERRGLFIEDLKQENQRLKTETQAISFGPDAERFISRMTDIITEENNLEIEDTLRFYNFLRQIKQTYLNRPQWEHGQQAYRYWLEKLRLARLAQAHAPHPVH
jgi:hypothetical protein